MLKHKKNCTDNLVVIQHRFLEVEGNGQLRKLYRLHCPNCDNNKTLNEEEANQWLQEHPVHVAPKAQ